MTSPTEDRQQRAKALARVRIGQVQKDRNYRIVLAVALPLTVDRTAQNHGSASEPQAVAYRDMGKIDQFAFFRRCRSVLYFNDLLSGRALKTTLRKHLLQTPVLFLERLEALRLGTLHTTMK